MTSKDKLINWWRTRVYHIKLLRWESRRDKARAGSMPFDDPKPELNLVGEEDDQP